MNRVLKLVFDVLEVYLGVVIFSMLLLSTFIQVFMRFVLNMPSPELFEVSIYTFVWVIYLGGALATRYDQHMRFDLIFRKLPLRGQLVLNTIFDFLTNVVLLFLLVPSLRYTFQVYSIKASALRIPWTYLLIVYPVFVALVLMHNFISIYFRIRELRGKGCKPEEVFPWL